MKLYRAKFVDVHSKNDVFVTFANNEEEVKQKLVNEMSRRDWYRDFLFDTTLDELLDEFEEQEYVFDELKHGEDHFAKEAYKVGQLPYWTVEELKHPDDKDVYVIFPEDVIDEDDIVILYVDKSVEDIDEHVLRYLGKLQTKKEHFIRHVIDPGINMNFNERFYEIHGKYAFEFPGERRVEISDHILNLFGGNEIEANRYINEQWDVNVKSFFKERPEFYSIYKDYILQTGDKTNLPFSIEFYEFVGYKLLKEKDWFEFKVQKIEKE